MSTEVPFDQQILLILVGAGIGLVSSVAGSIVGSLVQHRLGLDRERKRQWWERKASAYANILESLHHMNQYFRRMVDWEETKKEKPDEMRVSLRSSYREGLSRVDRAIDMGAFVIEADAVKALRALRTSISIPAWDRSISFYELLSEQWTAVEECLAVVRKIALTDLGVKRPEDS